MAGRARALIALLLAGAATAAADTCTGDEGNCSAVEAVPEDAAFLQVRGTDGADGSPQPKCRGHKEKVELKLNGQTVGFNTIPITVPTGQTLTILLCNSGNVVANTDTIVKEVPKTLVGDVGDGGKVYITAENYRNFDIDGDLTISSDVNLALPTHRDMMKSSLQVVRDGMDPAMVLHYRAKTTACIAGAPVPIPGSILAELNKTGASSNVPAVAPASRQAPVAVGASLLPEFVNGEIGKGALISIHIKNSGNVNLKSDTSSVLIDDGALMNQLVVAGSTNNLDGASIQISVSSSANVRGKNGQGVLYMSDLATKKSYLAAHGVMSNSFKGGTSVDATYTDFASVTVGRVWALSTDPAGSLFLTGMIVGHGPLPVDELMTMDVKLNMAQAGNLKVDNTLDGNHLPRMNDLIMLDGMKFDASTFALTVSNSGNFETANMAMTAGNLQLLSRAYVCTELRNSQATMKIGNSFNVKSPLQIIPITSTFPIVDSLLFVGSGIHSSKVEVDVQGSANLNVPECFAEGVEMMGFHLYSTIASMADIDDSTVTIKADDVYNWRGDMLYMKFVTLLEKILVADTSATNSVVTVQASKIANVYGDKKKAPVCFITPSLIDWGLSVQDDQGSQFKITLKEAAGVSAKAFDMSQQGMNSDASEFLLGGVMRLNKGSGSAVDAKVDKVANVQAAESVHLSESFLIRRALHIKKEFVESSTVKFKMSASAKVKAPKVDFEKSTCIRFLVSLLDAGVPAGSSIDFGVTDSGSVNVADSGTFSQQSSLVKNVVYSKADIAGSAKVDLVTTASITHSKQNVVFSDGSFLLGRVVRKASLDPGSVSLSLMHVANGYGVDFQDTSVRCDDENILGQFNPINTCVPK